MFTATDMVRPLNCIVAVSQNMGIGKNGDLPWPPLRYLRGWGWIERVGSELALADWGNWAPPGPADSRRRWGVS